MDLKLKGKVAIVTGGSKGIGAGIAKALAAEGVAVVVNYVSSKKDADAIVNQITGDGGNAVAVQGDVSKSADVKSLFDETIKAFGKLDILVNNAGIYKFAPIEMVTEESFREQFDINVLGPLLTMKEALKYFPATGGSIVNISSGASTNPPPNGSVYGASKAALDALSIALGRELAARKIRVNTISVGPTVTEGVKAQGLLGTDAEKYIIASSPFGRLGNPEDIASVVTFIASDAAGWITADRIYASGGLK